MSEPASPIQRFAASADEAIKAATALCIAIAKYLIWNNKETISIAANEKPPKPTTEPKVNTMVGPNYETLKNSTNPVNYASKIPINYSPRTEFKV